MVAHFREDWWQMAKSDVGDITLFGQAGIELWTDQRIGALRAWKRSILRAVECYPSIKSDVRIKELKRHLEECEKLAEAIGALVVEQEGGSKL